MINLNLISILLLTLLLLFILTLCFLDYRKKRVLRGKPKVSFLIPCYNDGDSVEDTIRSIYASYDPKRFELLVVNDKSTDGSLTVLKRLRKKYRFTLVNNAKNKGKSASLNALSRQAKHGILFVVDADVILNREALTDVLARLQEPGIGAVGAQYLPKNRGFLAAMQEAEYNMLSLIQWAHNRTSTISLCGGCFAMRKEAFEAVGKFSLNAIVEDMDMALKMKEGGYRVRASFYTVESYVPDNLKWWYQQKIRWSAGTLQNIVKHFRTWIRTPLNVLFMFLFSFISLVAALSLARQAVLIDNIVASYELLRLTTSNLLTLKAVGLLYGAIMLKNTILSVSFSAFSLPYVIPMVGEWKEIYKLLLAVPFGLLYLPVYSVVSTIGIVVGIVRYRALRKGERGW